jgi:fimbrial chaperone protein
MKQIRGQVRVNAWTQSNHQDILTPSKDLIASPMVLTIPAGQRQLVRLIRANAGNNSSEQAYRLIVDELPNPQLEKQSDFNFYLNIRFLFSLKLHPLNPFNKA